MFLAPATRTEDASGAARAKSMCSAMLSFASRTSITRPHTPASCQFRKRRQQLTPDPQPISAGNSVHRIRVISTNRMPVSAARSGTGLRPGYRKRRGLAGGSSGSINAHNGSSTMVSVTACSVGSVAPRKVRRPERALLTPGSTFILFVPCATKPVGPGVGQERVRAQCQSEPSVGGDSGDMPLAEAKRGQHRVPWTAWRLDSSKHPVIQPSA